MYAIRSYYAPSDRPILELSVVSKTDARKLYDLVENEILPQIQQIEGIGEARLIGGQEMEIQVNVNQDKLVHYNLSISQVINAINSRNNFV